MDSDGFIPDGQADGFVPDAAPAEQPGKLESFARGARSGLTFGFGDELTGLLEHVMTGKSYRQSRDEARAADRRAKKANPGTYLAGEIGGGVAGSLVPGGALVKGAGLGANIIRGAGAGILSGIGSSEADLTKGEVGELAKDAAISGLAGGAVGGVLGTVADKVIGGAAKRAENAELAGLKEGTQYSTRIKTFGKATPAAPEGQFAGEIKGALKSEPGIRKAIESEPGKALSMVEEKVAGLTDKLDDIYARAHIGSHGGGVPLDPVRTALSRVEQDFRATTATEGLADEVARVSQRLSERNPDGAISFQALREEYRAWQNIANRSQKLFSAKSPREEVAEDMANALRSTLQDHVERVAEANPSLGISRKALEDTNKEVSTWLKVKAALTEKATRENNASPPMGDLLSMARHPIRAIGKLAAPLQRPADVAMAKMVLAAKNGDPVAQMALRSIGTGIPRSAAENAEDIPGGALSAAASPFLPSDQPY